MKKYWLLLLMCCWLSQLFAQTLSTMGQWNPAVYGMISEAGLDYPLSIVSSANQTLIDVQTDPLGSANWRVQISRQDINWHGNLQLYMRCTGEGIGTGSINGINNYILLNTQPSDFLSGTESCNSIPIQYQITGLSVLLPVQTYSTNIVFTFIEL